MKDKNGEVAHVKVIKSMSFYSRQTTVNGDPIRLSNIYPLDSGILNNDNKRMIELPIVLQIIQIDRSHVLISDGKYQVPATLRLLMDIDFHVYDVVMILKWSIENNLVIIEKMKHLH